MHDFYRQVAPKVELLLSLVIGGLLVVSTPAEAREYEVEIDVANLEDLYELYQSGDIDEDTLRTLEALFQRPMNINRADRYLLYDLPGITYALADAIIAFRATHGPFGSIAGLGGVPGITPDILTSVAPFVTVQGIKQDVAEPSDQVDGRVWAGTIVRDGFNRDEEDIDQLVERERPPQSFLRFRGEGFTHLGAGGLVTHRRFIDAKWDRSLGRLVSEGPSNAVSLDSLYLYGGYGGWTILLGSYTVGFGERLTFDSTSRTHPNGLYPNDIVRYDVTRSTLSPERGQLGVAATVQGADFLGGWLDATLFASWTPVDLYQYDLNVGLDQWYGDNVCETDGDCPDGYTCGADRVCRSSRIYDASDPRADSFRYETHRDAFDERLAGANLTFHFDERAEIGVTGYYSNVSFNLAQEAEPLFALSARYPREGEIGALGVFGRWGQGPVDLAAEYARTQSGGDGVFGRLVWDPALWMEIVLSGRYYGPGFDNPHSRGKAARDELYGLAQRNEVGGALRLTMRPARRLRLVTVADTWGNPYLPQWSDSGELSYVEKDEMPVDLIVSQRISYGLTTHEDVSLVLDYRNKDIRNNTRAEVYERGDFCDEGLSDANCGRGERRKAQVRVATTRIEHSRLWASYTAAWQDVSKLATKLDFEQRIRVHASWAGWTGGRVALHAGFWVHQAQAPAVGDQDAPLSDRDEPRLDAYLELSQRIGERLAVWVRYGVLNYKDEHLTRYDWYQLGKLIVEARF